MTRARPPCRSGGLASVYRLALTVTSHIGPASEEEPLNDIPEEADHGESEGDPGPPRY